MSVGAPSRREGRERALTLLYEAEAKGVLPGALLDELPLAPPPFVVDLVAGVSRCQRRIDELIGQHAVDWTVARMAVIDRNVLRLGVYELLEHPDVPLGAVISEAVDLAKRYSTDDSGRFVNGVLSGVAAEVRPTDDA